MKASSEVGFKRLKENIMKRKDRRRTLIPIWTTLAKFCLFSIHPLIFIIQGPIEVPIKS